MRTRPSKGSHPCPPCVSSRTGTKASVLCQSSKKSGVTVIVVEFLNFPITMQAAAPDFSAGLSTATFACTCQGPLASQPSGPPLRGPSEKCTGGLLSHSSRREASSQLPGDTDTLLQARVAWGWPGGGAVSTPLEPITTFKNASFTMKLSNSHSNGKKDSCRGHLYLASK